MALRNFKHASAGTLDEAAALAGESEKSAYLAGGTDLLGALKDNIHPDYPELVVDLKTVPGLRRIRRTKAGLAIGALTSLAELASHKAVRELYPLLAEAAKAVASPQIRNMATVGGNLCQEPRCWYYRTPDNLFHCLRKGGKTCNAFFGENRYHSIFGAARAADPPCELNCPNHADIPGLMSAVRRGDLRRAAGILLERNPMPAVTGRVCPHPCETDCGRRGHDAPVSIREVERFVGDRILEGMEEHFQAPKAETKKSVAVVGAGPAGMTAAYFLRKAGHRVTLIDRMAKPGGMLAYAIPSYRLPKEVVLKQACALERMGVLFKLNAEAGGGGLSLKALRKKYDAVFLSTGAWRAKLLELEKAELLQSGLRFLIDIQRGAAPAVGRRVLVIGGGSVAVDVAISALRLGAAEVSLACLESDKEMPAVPEDLEQANREKVKILTSWGPLKVVAEGKALKGLELVRCTSVFDAEGRFKPVFDPKITLKVEADQVLLAIGQAAELDYARELKAERGLILADKETSATNLAGVFAGGDAVSGPATVVKAISTGREAAASIAAYLSGGKRKAPREPSTERPLLEFDGSALEKSERAPALESPESRGGIDGEDRATLDPLAICEEARRCANCGCVAVNASDLAPALLALKASIVTTRRTLAAEDFFAAGPMKTTALEAGELVKEIVVPRPRAGGRQSFLKFRLRQAIDFPIVSVASVLVMEGGKVKEARLVLGAVAPVPLRAGQAEDYLKGRKLDGKTAAEAGSIAVRGVLPLAKNKFKAQLARALLRKALLGRSSV